MALSIGTQAPDFTLKSKTSGDLKDVTLSQETAGSKVVLLFFPLAWTSVCTEEMCMVSSGIQAYKDLNAKVFGISVDSPFALEVFAREQKIEFPLLSDFNREVCRAYDVLFEELLGFHAVAKRAAYVIGTDGKILYSGASDDPKQLPDFDAVKAALAG
ncbi:MAG: redoxin domain-containing protein [Opitutales bacterium]